ncbi:MAG: hypothetical protein ACXVNR_06435, partial [Bacteroidia bacterium]
VMTKAKRKSAAKNTANAAKKVRKKTKLKIKRKSNSVLNLIKSPSVNSGGLFFWAFPHLRYQLFLMCHCATAGSGCCGVPLFAGSSHSYIKSRWQKSPAGPLHP